MDENSVPGKLPSELINEKSFYTLGGASSAVVLICWVINYVFGDFLLPNSGTYRIVGLILSEFFAVIIVLQQKDRRMIKWLFAFLNGLLIFVNASGLNAMTASTDSDSDKTKQIAYNYSPKYQSFSTQQAGIFSLPGMINWWPDEKLIAKNVLLTETNRNLNVENIRLKASLPATPEKKNDLLAIQNDSLRWLKSQLAEKEKQVRELSAAARNNGDNLQKRLTACLEEKTAIADSLILYRNKFRSCEQQNHDLLQNSSLFRDEKNKLSDRIQLLQKQIRTCTGEKSATQDKLNNCTTQLDSLKKQLEVCKQKLSPIKRSAIEIRPRPRENSNDIK